MLFALTSFTASGSCLVENSSDSSYSAEWGQETDRSFLGGIGLREELQFGCAGFDLFFQENLMMLAKQK